MRQNIPLHGFSQDDATSIPFRLVPLEYKTAYDTSVPHRHNYYEIFVFVEGGGYHDIDFQVFDIHDHSVHFVSPGQVHLVRRALRSRGYVIYFSRDFYHLNFQDKNLLFDLPFLNNNSPRPILNMDAGAFAVIQGLMGQIALEAQSADPFREELIRSYLNILLIECRRRFNEQESADESPGSRQFRQFKVMLEQNFTHKHQVQDYANLLSITEKHLNELCKKATGRTASDLIHDRILLEAKRLLLHSDLNNKEIAYFLHFEDPSHFSKFFKRLAGATPSEFRTGLEQKYGG